MIKDNPLLRKKTFPSDWEVKHFEEVADIDRECLNGSTPKDYEFEYISLSDVSSDDLKFETTKQIFATAPSRARRIVKKGDILMSTVRPNLQGFTLIRDEAINLIASTGFAVITATKCNNEFLYQYLFSSEISRQFHHLLVGTNYPAINSSDIRKLKLVVPSIQEQKAIAHILSLIDLAINKNNSLLNKKESQKKWLMQKLLNGEKRLRGFEKQKWKIRLLQDILIPVSRPIEKPESRFLALGIRSHGKGTFLKQDFEPEKIEMETLFVVRENDLIVNITFAWEGAIAIVRKQDDGALVSHRFPTFTFNKDVAVIDFFRHFILQQKFKYLLDSISPGGAGRNRVLSKKDFLKLEVKIPTLEEQIAIANLLQTADKEIQLLMLKTKKLQEQKRGLMQQLFTGKKRIR